MKLEKKSKYFMGWLLVLFDLPVTTKKERQVATKFRNRLLDLGYLMFQYSVYARCAVTLSKKEKLINNLKKINPGTGHIQCFFLTDAQWKNSTILHANKKLKKRTIKSDTNIDQQLLFW